MSTKATGDSYRSARQDFLWWVEGLDKEQSISWLTQQIGGMLKQRDDLNTKLNAALDLRAQYQEGKR